MKAVKLVVGFVLAVCLVIGLGINAEASDYLGEFCFQHNFEKGSMAGQSGIGKLNVYDMGDGTFSYTFNVSQTLVRGTAVINGNKIHMASTKTGWFGDDGAYIMTNYSEIDATTLNGTFRGLDIEGTLGSPGQISYFSGTLTHVQCP